MARPIVISIQVVLMVSLMLNVASAEATTLNELLRKADMVTRSKTSAAVFEMSIKTGSFKRDFRVLVWDDRRDSEKSLIKILGPALWRGYGTLKIGNQLKMFNPKSNHVTVVGNSMLGDSWMGSHFTNDDLVKETQLAKHYTLSLSNKRKGTHGDLGGGTFYRLKLRPAPTAPVAWGRIDYVLWEKGAIVLPVAAEYFRNFNDSKPARKMTFSSPKLMGGRIVPAVMTLTVARKPNEYTKLIYRKLRFDIKIPGNKFTEQALRR